MAGDETETETPVESATPVVEPATERMPLATIASTSDGAGEEDVEAKLAYDSLMRHRKQQRRKKIVRAVVIVAVLPDGKLVFERQFRYPVGEVFLELPAGKLDPDETILACAQRELLEVTGYRAEHWQHLGVMHPCIGYSDERIEIFFARDLHFEGQKLDDGEFLEIVALSYDEGQAAALDGSMTDAKTITALFRARDLLAGR